jgi:hypothetical protein
LVFRRCATRRCLGATECFSTLGSTKIAAEARPGNPGLRWLGLVRGFWFHSAGWVGLGFFWGCVTFRKWRAPRSRAPIDKPQFPAGVRTKSKLGREVPLGR